MVNTNDNQTIANPHPRSAYAPRSRSSLTAGLCLSLFGGPFIAGFGLVALHSWVLGPILWAVVVTILDASRRPNHRLESVFVGLTAGVLACAGAVAALWIALSNCNGCLS